VNDKLNFFAVQKFRHAVKGRKNKKNWVND